MGKIITNRVEGLKTRNLRERLGPPSWSNFSIAREDLGECPSGCDCLLRCRGIAAQTGKDVVPGDDTCQEAFAAQKGASLTS